MNADVILMILTPASLDIVIRLEMQSAWRSSSKTRYNIALSSYIPVGFHSCTDGVWSELHKACSDFQSYFLEPKAKWWNTQNCSRFSSKWYQHIHRHTCCWMRQMLCFMLGLLFYDFHDYLFELLEKVLLLFFFLFVFCCCSGICSFIFKELHWTSELRHLTALFIFHLMAERKRALHL